MSAETLIGTEATTGECGKCRGPKVLAERGFNGITYKYVECARCLRIPVHCACDRPDPDDMSGVTLHLYLDKIGKLAERSATGARTVGETVSSTTLDAAGRVSVDFVTGEHAARALDAFTAAGLMAEQANRRLVVTGWRDDDCQLAWYLRRSLCERVDDACSGQDAALLDEVAAVKAVIVSWREAAAEAEKLTAGRFFAAHAEAYTLMAQTWRSAVLLLAQAYAGGPGWWPRWQLAPQAVRRSAGGVIRP